MRFVDIFLLFIGIVLIGLSILKIFPKWVIYIGLVSFSVMGIRLVIQGIKSKMATRPSRPTIEDLESQEQEKAEREARKKIIEDELKRYKKKDTIKKPDMP